MAMDGNRAWAIEPGLPITPQIYDQLRARIIRNELAPGNRISEAEIARACHVSRQPVREAFIKLAEQGLVAVLPQRGTIVSKIAYRAVLDARYVREAVEADIVRALAARPDPDLIRTLRHQLDLQRAADSADSFIRLDETFHRRLAEGAGKGGVWHLLDGLKSQMDRVRFLALGQFPQAKLVTQHSQIVALIADGDVEAAETAMRRHLREVLEDLPRIVAAHADAFDLADGTIPAADPIPIEGGETP